MFRSIPLLERFVVSPRLVLLFWNQCALAVGVEAIRLGVFSMH
ncbi:hypothetical protein RMSM_00591 [Rhodopirellula maiorica SM1]|uniref:Uncharacterized protein n=1 Tax=Rhodopirellula maiorica SM1 TaxID=1265738 RepID=M5RT11_9BACT|nr:hypothetical protein RMSM_00591 [Rhodopirellula maiorica SM1]